jgi:serine/threonine protein phosphatase PrpC
MGDSRLYRFEGPNCAERTIDHSHVENLVRQGKLSREEAPKHPLANVLINALGMSEHLPQVVVHRRERLRAGDAFLLCSDGLWHYFSDAELGAAIAMNSPRQASEMLINKARERAIGTSADNCTLAVLKLVEPPKEQRNYTVEKMRRAV